ncbi:MAG: radical SAM protein, partial [Flavobacteriales bacterium]|nr:radical SAM protein [Flavobacteriales bacterium]
GLDFERIVLVKRNALQLFEKELRKPTWKGEPISLSGATDPYQPCEKRERITSGLLELALDFGQPILLITKNALVLRDIDVLAALADRRLVHVALSLTTLNEDLRRVLEPRTSTGAKRLAAMRTLTAAGVPTFAMLAPIVPTLNEPEIPGLLRAAAEAGAMGAGYSVLRTNGPVQVVFEQWLHTHVPDRAQKVIAQTKALHGGRMQDSKAGRRMKGEGEFAQNIERLFRVMRKRYFGDRKLPELDRTAFRPPPTGQLGLFH